MHNIIPNISFCYYFFLTFYFLFLGIAFFLKTNYHIFKSLVNSVGRVAALQAASHRFEPGWVYSKKITTSLLLAFRLDYK